MNTTAKKVIKKPGTQESRRGKVKTKETVLLHRSLSLRLQRIQTGAAAERLMESLAEMAGTGITDFQRGFGHVVLAGTQQLRGFLHAQPTQILRDRLAGLRRKN